jgi:hypothetical protein
MLPRAYDDHVTDQATATARAQLVQLLAHRRQYRSIEDLRSAFRIEVDPADMSVEEEVRSPLRS